MSGGHYDYIYFKLDELADMIERDFVNGGKYEDEDWSISQDDLWKYPTNRRPKIWVDPFAHDTQENKEKLYKEVKNLIKSLKRDSRRAKYLDWLMSGDHSLSSYIEVINKTQ